MKTYLTDLVKEFKTHDIKYLSDLLNTAADKQYNRAIRKGEINLIYSPSLELKAYEITQRYLQMKNRR